MPPIRNITNFFANTWKAEISLLRKPKAKKKKTKNESKLSFKGQQTKVNFYERSGGVLSKCIRALRRGRAYKCLAGRGARIKIEREHFLMLICCASRPSPHIWNAFPSDPGEFCFSFFLLLAIKRTFAAGFVLYFERIKLFSVFKQAPDGKATLEVRINSNLAVGIERDLRAESWVRKSLARIQNIIPALCFSFASSTTINRLIPPRAWYFKQICYSYEPSQWL